MDDDERAIRELVETWMEATRSGDVATVLGLMTDDVLFLTPGREPFGKDAFRDSLETMRGARIDGRSDIQELRVLGDWAWIRNHLDIRIGQPGGEAVHRSGYTLTILRKGEDGAWRLKRDANFVS